jgi:hypothetical protein
MNEAEIIDWSLLQEPPDGTFEEAVSWAFLEAQSALTASANLQMLKFLANEEARPWDEQNPLARLQRDDWTLELILVYERCYLASRNTAFVFLARQVKTLLTEPAAYAARLKWIDDYFDDVSRRMTELAWAPPSQRDAAIAEALGFGPAKPGGSSEFSEVKRAISDFRLGITVELCLAANNGKQQVTFEEVGSCLGKSGSAVGRAYKRYCRLKGQ